MNDFLKDIIKETGNEYASLVADGVEAGDTDTFIDLVSIDRIKKNSLSFLYDEEVIPRNLHKDSYIIFSSKKFLLNL